MPRDVTLHAPLRRRMRFVAIACCGLSVIGGNARARQPATAPAEATPDARALFRIAEQHFTLGAFDKAVEHYRRAYALQPLPAFLFNIAQSYRNLGDCRQAVFYYRRYLALEPASSYAPEVRRIIDDCRALAARRPAPAPASSALAARHGGLRGPRPGPAPARLQASAVATDARGQRRRVLLWTGLGLTASFAAVGALTAGLALDKHSSYQDPTTPDTRRPELRSSGQNLATAANICFALSGAAAAATALAYWLYRPRQAARVSAALVPQPDGALLTLGGLL